MPRTSLSIDAGILSAALAGLEAERQRLEEQIAQVRAILGNGRGQALGKAPAMIRAKRRLSAAARKSISDAQKRRWEEYRKRRAAAA